MEARLQKLIRDELEHVRWLRPERSRRPWDGSWETKWQIRRWLERLEEVVSTPVREQVAWRVGHWVQARVEAEVRERVPSWEAARPSSVEVGGASVQAFMAAPEFTVVRFFAQVSQSREALALADLNRLVSGYWLARDQAILVRRPTRLKRDERGRLHSASGPAIAYADGWRCHAWQGVPVSARVILTPEALTVEDCPKAANVEGWRVIQERMVERFLGELRAVVVDASSRGVLYEVDLIDDPELVARYLRVQDASTPRRYLLRVPPRIQRAAEAAAGRSTCRWSSISPSRKPEPGLSPRSVARSRWQRGLSGVQAPLRRCAAPVRSLASAVCNTKSRPSGNCGRVRTCGGSGAEP